MKIYNIKYSTKLKEIGKYPQVSSAKFIDRWDSPKALGMIFKEKVTRTDIEIPEFVLDTRAKKTDLVSQVYLGYMLVISQKLKTAIENSRFSEIQFFKTTLHEKDSLGELFWILNPYGFKNHWIDFSSSIIQCDDNLESYFVSVPDENAFSQLKEDGQKNDKRYFIREPVLVENQIKEDFFALEWVNGGVDYFISQTLKEKIEAIKCTGMTFTEVKTLY